MSKMFCKDCNEICERKTRFAKYCEKCLKKRVETRTNRMKKTFEKKLYLRMTYDIKFHSGEKPKRKEVKHEQKL